jgi:hypothetical protein
MAEEYGDIKVMGVLEVVGVTTMSTVHITTSANIALLTVSTISITNPVILPNGSNAVKNDASVNPTNLLSNGDFENHSAGTTAVPDGFALENTPTLATDTGDIGYGSISQKITAAGAGLEGIKYTLSGLRASTTYSVSWRTKVTAGDTSQVLTTGAGTDLAATESTSTTFETKTGTFITDASGTAVVLKFMAKADGDIVWFDGIQVNCGESAFAFSDKPVLGSDTSTTAVATKIPVMGTNGYLPDASVDTTALKTATGEISFTAEGAGILPGGSYGFYPQVKGSSGTAKGTLAILGNPSSVNQAPGTTYITNCYAGIGEATIYVQQRYVTASGQDHWLFLLIDKITKDIIIGYSAPDHPAYGNGGDFDKMPHPFGSYDETKQEIVLLDKETCNLLKQESKDTGKSILTLVNEEYKPNISDQIYQPLHSGKFLTENKEGKQIQVKQMVTSIPAYIKVRKLDKLTPEEIEAQKAQAEIDQAEAKVVADAEAEKEKLIQAKIREIAIDVLKTEGKLDIND